MGCHGGDINTVKEILPKRATIEDVHDYLSFDYYYVNFSEMPHKHMMIQVFRFYIR